MSRPSRFIWRSCALLRRDHRDKPGDDGIALLVMPALVAGIHVLTLILYDSIPNNVRSARGRSHEASCGWDRMRRPRPGEDASPALGRRRELRPAATMSRPPGAGSRGPTARYVLRPKREARAGVTDGPCKARPGAVRKTPRWRAMRRPRLSRGSAAQNEQWLRHLARHLPRVCEGEIVEKGDRPAQGLDKQHGR